MKAGGPWGRLTVGGRVAAKLGAWRFEGDAAAWGVTAACLSVDEYWAEHGGAMTLELGFGAAVWSWPVVEVKGIAPETVVAGIGWPAVSGR